MNIPYLRDQSLIGSERGASLLAAAGLHPARWQHMISTERYPNEPHHVAPLGASVPPRAWVWTDRDIAIIQLHPALSLRGRWAAPSYCPVPETAAIHPASCRSGMVTAMPLPDTSFPQQRTTGSLLAIAGRYTAQSTVRLSEPDRSYHAPISPKNRPSGAAACSEDVQMKVRSSAEGGAQPFVSHAGRTVSVWVCPSV